jgi:hypothetical protein
MWPMTDLGQKCPKRLRLLVGKNTHEYMGRIVPKADLPCRLPRDDKVLMTPAHEAAPLHL